VIRKRH